MVINQSCLIVHFEVLPTSCRARCDVWAIASSCVDRFTNRSGTMHDLPHSRNPTVLLQHRRDASGYSDTVATGQENRLNVGSRPLLERIWTAETTGLEPSESTGAFGDQNIPAGRQSFRRTRRPAQRLRNAPIVRPDAPKQSS